MQIMDPWQESPKYPDQHSQGVDASDLSTEALPGVVALAPCLLPSEGEREPIEFKTLHLCFHEQGHTSRNIFKVGQ